MAKKTKSKSSSRDGIRQSVNYQGVQLGTGSTAAVRTSTTRASVRRSSSNYKVVSTHEEGVPPSPFRLSTTTTNNNNPTVRPSLQHAVPLLSRNPVDQFIRQIQDYFGQQPSYWKTKKKTTTTTPTALTQSVSQWQRQQQAASPQQYHRVSFLALLSYSTWSEQIWMIIGLFFAGLAGLCLPCWLILLARTLDTFSSIAQLILIGAGEAAYEALRTNLNELCIAFALLGAISLAVGFIYVSIWTYTGERQSLRIKEQFVHATLRQDAEWFDINNRDELPTAIANAMIHIQAAIGRPMADLFANAISAFASLGVALALNAPLALVMLCVVPVVAVVIMIGSCFSRKQSQRASASFVAAGALATEVISGIKTVASLCAERWALTAYTYNIQKAQYHSIKAGILTGFMSGMTGLLFYATYSVAFAIGTEQVARDMRISVIITCIFSDDSTCRVSGASVICCIYGVILCATFLGLMAPGLTNINLGRQAAAQIFATIERMPVIDGDSQYGTALDQLQGGIEFKNVYFAYPSQPQRMIFANFNLKIEAGSSVAFVGPSGSGKSTIAKLLLRFYCPVAGGILVEDGSQQHPLGSLKLPWWRSQVGYVAQSPILFPGTMRYNIACGKPGATNAEVVEAAKAACAHEFLMDLPNGYDTYYSGASIQLSGGQMQRICIARAMIRKPSILLLDEATSALDTNSERQVQNALAHIRLHQKMTTISVAHRLSTIVHCDQIAVISDGTIAELGSHQSLLAMDGIYATLCESQGITAESTFDAPATNPRASTNDDIEISLNNNSKNDIKASSFDVESGLVKSSSTVEEPAKVMKLDLEKETLASSWRIVSLNKPEWCFLLVGVMGALVVGALAPAEGILTARIVERFYTVDADDLMEANRDDILYFLVFAGAALAGNLLSGWGFSVAGYRLSARMRSLVFEAVIRRNIGWFDVPEHSVGELTSRLEGDAEEVAKITGWALGYRVRVFSSLVAGIAIAMIFSWQVGLVTIMCVPIIMASSFVQKLCLNREESIPQEGLSPETIFENGLRGIDAVQSYGLQNAVAEDYSAALIPQAQKQIRMGVTSGLVYGLSQFATFGSFAIIFYVGVELLVTGKANFREFFTPILAIMFGTLGISQVNADFNAQQDGLAAAGRIFQIIDEPLDEMDPFGEAGVRPESLKGEIVFQSCTFAYPTRPNNPVYYASGDHDGFSLSVNPKESIAFVGKSGSGKSTALQILLRFYNVSDGEVLLDGVKLQDINIPWLRRQIGYVGQNPTLFAGSIRDNILLGNPKATEDEIIEAARAANAHDFIMKQSLGYDTEIGSGGSLLSGGQRQRIAIARAIVSNPKMLVLDEATAALDNESERIVQEALDNLQKAYPRTTLVVAHRLSTVKDCNQIAVLGNGGVLELGSHSELLDGRGLYHELWRKQGA